MASAQDAVRDRIEQELATPLGALGLDVEAVELTAGRQAPRSCGSRSTATTA